MYFFIITFKVSLNVGAKNSVKLLLPKKKKSNNSLEEKVSKNSYNRCLIKFFNIYMSDLFTR